MSFSVDLSAASVWNDVADGCYIAENEVLAYLELGEPSFLPNRPALDNSHSLHHYPRPFADKIDQDECDRNARPSSRGPAVRAASEPFECRGCGWNNVAVAKLQKEVDLICEDRDGLSVASLSCPPDSPRRSIELSPQPNRRSEERRDTSHPNSHERRDTLAPSRSPSAAAESEPAAEYEEWPLHGFLKRTRIGRTMMFNLEFHLTHIPEHLEKSGLSERLRSNITTPAQRQTSSDAAYSKTPDVHLGHSRKRILWTKEEDKTLVKMKEEDGCSWEEISTAIPSRTAGAIQVRYSIKFGSGRVSRKRRRS